MLLDGESYRQVSQWYQYTYFLLECSGKCAHYEMMLLDGESSRSGDILVLAQLPVFLRGCIIYTAKQADLGWRPRPKKFKKYRWSPIPLS